MGENWVGARKFRNRYAHAYTVSQIVMHPNGDDPFLNTSLPYFQKSVHKMGKLLNLKNLLDSDSNTSDTCNLKKTLPNAGR